MARQDTGEAGEGSAWRAQRACGSRDPYRHEPEHEAPL